MRGVNDGPAIRWNPITSYLTPIIGGVRLRIQYDGFMFPVLPESTKGLLDGIRQRDR